MRTAFALLEDILCPRRVCTAYEHCTCMAGEALATNRSLRRVDLRSNHCGDAGAFAFSEVSLKSVVKV